MDELKTWWEIAQLAGAGAAVVLGPVAILLWRRNERDTEYIRDADRNSLVVLHELTKTIEGWNMTLDTKHNDLMTAITTATERIKSHITENGK